MPGQLLADVLPEYTSGLASRLRAAGWGHLAETLREVRFTRVAVADDRCGFLTGSDDADRVGALRLELDEEMVDVKFDRIVYIEICAPQPARLAVRGLTAAVTSPA